MKENEKIENEAPPIEAEPVDEPVERMLALTPASSAEGVEIDSQISTAHQYPRSLTRYKQNAMAMATSDQETAESCFYSLRRGGKLIEGPTVRMAEIVGAAWGNMRYGARITREEDKFIVAQGTCHDLENNVACCVEVRRRITDKTGNRYNDDMIGVTANAACSIALRNAVFKVVPRVFVDPVYEAAKKVAVGNANTLTKRRQGALDYFGKLGVKPEALFQYLGINGEDEIDLKVLERMTGLKTAITEGDVQLEELFPSQPMAPKRKSEKEQREAK